MPKFSGVISDIAQKEEIMRLPIIVEEKVNELYLKTKNNSLSKAREKLTYKYKSSSKSGQKLIENREEASLYALTRMPCTYAVIRTLIEELYAEGKLQNIETVIDVGAGTGAGYFAIKDFDKNIQITPVEYDKNMISIFNELVPEVKVINSDILTDKIERTADLVVSSYMLNELSDENRLIAVKNMLALTNRYLLLIDAGTPKVYNDMMIIKDFVSESNAKVTAPCMTNTCPLKNDYCQFYVRVERSSLLRQSKSAKLPYEDEKYFYLLIEKINTEAFYELKENQGRVLRRPIIKPNMVELVLCRNDGIQNKIITQKNKSEFKKAKKIKIHQIF